jgi:hypothetical protein
MAKQKISPDYNFFTSVFQVTGFGTGLATGAKNADFHSLIVFKILFLSRKLIIVLCKLMLKTVIFQIEYWIVMHIFQ